LELEIFRAEISELRIIKQNSFAVLVFEGSGEFQPPPPSPRPIKVIEKKIGKKLNKSELVEFWSLVGS
jgi:hypothetical protein